MSAAVKDDAQTSFNARFLISLVVTIGFTLVGGYALYHLTKSVDPGAIAQSIGGIPAWRLVVASAFAFLCYVALSGYDIIALRALNYRLSWRRAIAGSTSAYALSHNLGFAPLTASYARHRIYTRDGVSLGDIARIVLLCGTAFWLGVLFIMGLCLIVAPGLLTIYWKDASSAFQHLVGWGIVAFTCGYLIAIKLGLKRLGFGRFYVPLPNFGDAVIQLLVSLAEMMLAAGIIFILIPGIDPALYPQLLAAYVIAFTAVLITHAPGGVGVLEAIILLLLPQVDKAALLSALILFRLIFHVAPLAVAMLILMAHRPSGRSLKPA